MSIGKRFIDLARAELNSLLDFAAGRSDGDEDGDGPHSGGGGGRRGGDLDHEGLSGFSRRELEEELARRRSAHEEVEEAIRGGRGPTPSESRAQARRGAPGAARPSGATGPRPASASELRKVELAYAALELAPGASFETVRTAYRNLMRKYHPDHHTSSPEAQRAANELAQRLTEAYKLLQSRLDR